MLQLSCPGQLSRALWWVSGQLCSALVPWAGRWGWEWCSLLRRADCLTVWPWVQLVGSQLRPRRRTWRPVLAADQTRHVHCKESG